MRITEAKAQDLPSILELQKKCYIQEAEIYDDYQIPPLTQDLNSISQDFDQQLFLKVESNERIIASVRAYQENGTCNIGRLIVHPEFQNKGIGKQLMAEIEKQFESARRYELFTGHKSLKNVSFYNKLGYAEYERKKINEGLLLVYLQKQNTAFP